MHRVHDLSDDGAAAAAAVPAGSEKDAEQAAGRVPGIRISPPRVSSLGSKASAAAARSDTALPATSAPPPKRCAGRDALGARCGFWAAPGISAFCSKCRMKERAQETCTGKSDADPKPKRRLIKKQKKIAKKGAAGKAQRNFKRGSTGTGGSGSSSNGSGSSSTTSAARSSLENGDEAVGSGTKIRLPYGWEEIRKHAKSCSYSIYIGPAGQRARSAVQAWRVQTGQDVAHSTSDSAQSPRVGIHSKISKSAIQKGSKGAVGEKKKMEKAKAAAALAARLHAAKVNREAKAIAKAAAKAEAKAAAEAAAAATVRCHPERSALFDDAEGVPTLTCGTMPTRANAHNLASLTLRAIDMLPVRSSSSASTTEAVESVATTSSVQPAGGRSPIGLESDARGSDCVDAFSPHSRSELKEHAAAQPSISPEEGVQTTCTARPERLIVLLCEEMRALATQGHGDWQSPECRSRALQVDAATHYEGGRWQECADSCTAGLALCMSGATFLYSRGTSGVPRLHESGYLKSVAGCEKLCVELLTRRGDARLHIGLREGAIRDFEGALAFEPENTEITSCLKRARSTTGNANAKGDFLARMRDAASALCDAIGGQSATSMEVAVFFIPIAVGSASLRSSRDATEAYAFLNTAADFLHTSRRPTDGLLVCSSAPAVARLPSQLPSQPEAPASASSSSATGMKRKKEQQQTSISPPEAAPKETADGDGLTRNEKRNDAKARPAQADAWARACLFAYEVRWRSALPSELLGRCGIRKSPLRELLSDYYPVLFSISLFETAPGSKSFIYYSAATVAYVLDKVSVFGGCEFLLHLNAGAASHSGLLRRLHEVSFGRISFAEYAFVPRPRIAPWLLAAFRLAPLLDHRGRTVVTTDIHDDLVLQNAQIHALIKRIRREKKDLCLTWWLAEDCADDCLMNSALPVARLRQYVTDRWYHTSGSDGGLGLHAHMDAGMMIATGTALRENLLKAHEGQTFIEFLTGLVRGAPSIPHGIEEMAWDAYLQAAGWPLLLPHVHFSVHRSLLAGRDSDDPFAGIEVSSDIPYALSIRREEIDVGKATFGNDLPTCRHSQALDCAEDSANWLEEQTNSSAAKATKRKKCVGSTPEPAAAGSPTITQPAED